MFFLASLTRGSLSPRSGRSAGWPLPQVGLSMLAPPGRPPNPPIDVMKEGDDDDDGDAGFELEEKHLLFWLLWLLLVRGQELALQQEDAGDAEPLQEAPREAAAEWVDGSGCC